VELPPASGRSIYKASHLDPFIGENGAVESSAAMGEKTIDKGLVAKGDCIIVGCDSKKVLASKA
jgi:hypothetical protein